MFSILLSFWVGCVNPGVFDPDLKLVEIFIVVAVKSSKGVFAILPFVLSI